MPSVTEAPQVVRLHTGALEAQVMDVLWDRGGWSTPGEVHEVVGADRPLAYTTTMTILVRLWRKGRLDRQRDGRAYAYRPLNNREEHAGLGMSDLLSQVNNRPAALSHFIESLSQADRDQLRRILRNAGPE